MSDRMRDRTEAHRPWHRRWAMRAGIAIVSWVLVATLLRLGDADVQVGLLATLVAAIAICSWLGIDLEARIQPSDWELTSTVTTRARGDDQRMRRIQRQLRDHVEERRPLDPVHVIIVELVDDRVLATHGVDRLTDPERYDQLVGPELASFVSSPPDAVRLRNPGAAARLLDRIESL